MAKQKVKGIQYSIKTAQSQILKWMDEMFPKEAPHHIVVMSDEDYKKRQEERLDNQYFKVRERDIKCKCGYEKGENPNCSYCKQFAESQTVDS